MAVLDYYLSKSQFLTGLRCHKYLWWLVHEPEAPELRPSDILLDRFDQGREVGERARTYVPGGELIGTPFVPLAERIELTRRALASGAPVLYEAAFEADGVRVIVDIFERTADGFTLIEVKQNTSVKPEHIPDAAIQVHVARRAGVPITRVEVMHLNDECRFPDLSNLFSRADVTTEVQNVLPGLAEAIQGQRQAVAGPLPDVPIGDHCRRPTPCPFMSRCWPRLPKYHITTLYRLHAKKLSRLQDLGVETIPSIPDDFKLTATQARQRGAIRAGRVLVEPTLGPALQRIREPLAFLDFETVARAVPVWHGCRPWQQVPAQFSCHVRREDGQTEHHEWLADGPGDPRRELATRLIEACQDVHQVLAYNASFEQDCILHLADVFPDLREQLLRIAERLGDLLPIVREGVYHPEFNGGFGLKAVAPALVPEVSYDDLVIASGGEATLELARLLLTTDELGREERQDVRRQLLEYCKRDTWCLVRLLDRLRDLVGAA
ncbi:MAG TPA: DUF2779 domain-containing protein [Gemmatimonadales bacterium]|nr:DUF2779 domain-containing protein [Gemmatimonadales bacterium]